jgi:predicted enzyme related to lactoylglutathione lyase
MLVESVHHIAIIVGDLTRARDFYESCFELSPIPRANEGMSKNPGAWYKVGAGAHALELHLQTRSSDTPKSDQHFALLCTNVEKICVRVVEKGGRVEEAKLIPGFSKRCFVHDLDGNRIELLAK